MWLAIFSTLSLKPIYLILQALKAFLEDVTSRINRVNPKMESTQTILRRNIHSLQTFVSSPQAKDPSILSYAARDFAYSLARTYMGKLFSSFNYFLSFVLFCFILHFLSEVSSLNHIRYSKRNYRISHQRCSIKTLFLKFLQYWQENTCYSILNKVSGFSFIKKRLQLRCFPVNIAKCSRTPILKNTCERLLL